MLTTEQRQPWGKWSSGRRRIFPSAIAISGLGLPAVLFLLTLFHFWLAASLPPAEDELYYWNWAKSLQWSYFDHPGMVAYFIRATTAIFGQSLFAIRLGACLVGTLVFYLLTLLTGRVDILVYALLTPILLLGSVLMTPDVPLVLFWTLYLFWVVALNRTFAGWHGNPLDRVYAASPVSLGRWGLGGVLLGLGMLSKYTMALAVGCTFMVLVSRYRPRAWLAGFVFHVAVATAVCLPILFFNVQHDFAPLKFQWAHSMGSWDFSLKMFGEFIGGQVLLLGALPFLMLPWIVGRAKELHQDPKLGACFHFFVWPMLFFLFQATKGKLEANWPLVAYLAFWPIAQRLLDEMSFKSLGAFLVRLAFAVPLLASALLLAHTIHPLKTVPPQMDRLGKLVEQERLAQEATADLARLNSARLPFFASNYQWTAYFRYGGIAAAQIHPEGRQSNFTMDGREVCRERAALVFQSAWVPPRVLKCFEKREVLKEYPVMVRGQESGRFLLVKYWH